MYLICSYVFFILELFVSSHVSCLFDTFVVEFLLACLQCALSCALLLVFETVSDSEHL